MGTTSTGLPYPDGTAPVRDGDNAIKALADELNTRVPWKTYQTSGGYSTNAYGGIVLTVPFASTILAVAIAAVESPIAFRRSTAAPAGQCWINAFNTTDGTLVASTFIIMDIIVMGY
jgi:hypothetical protein